MHNEKPRDLLVDPKKSTVLQVRESPEVGVFVEGLSRHKVTTAEDVEMLIFSGTQYRTIATTIFNRESSRSHAVFELTLTQVFRTAGCDSMTMQKRSRINLIDLAGSERTGKIGNKGVVFEEGASINKSLTVLGRCIKALAKMNRRGDLGKNISVPFRESVLTWYLRESLAGNAKTTMLANISPASSNGNETYGTLRYAAEAKRIETRVHMNEDPIQRQLRQQQEEITRLRQQLAELEDSPSTFGPENKRNGYADADERDALLSALEELRRSSWDAVRSSARFSAEDLGHQHQNQHQPASSDALYPLLITLTPDPMLSGKLKYSIQKPDKTPFRIGRAKNLDLCLDGIGICQQHCEIERLVSHRRGGLNQTTCGGSNAVADNEIDRSGLHSRDSDGTSGGRTGTREDADGGPEFGLRLYGSAKVHINGALLEGAQGGGKARWRRSALNGTLANRNTSSGSFASDVIDGSQLNVVEPLTPLHHGDRIILGPCRFVAVFMAFEPDLGDDIEAGLVGDDEESVAERRRQHAQGGVTTRPGGRLWEYSAVVAEMMHCVGRVPRLFGNSFDAISEGRLWEELLRGMELVNQANGIAAEMMVNVDFCAAMTTTLPPEFDETQMHELPALGAHIIIHCRAVLPLSDRSDRSPRGGESSPTTPRSFLATTRAGSEGEFPSSSTSPSPSPHRSPKLARVQSRDSDVNFLHTQNQRQQQGMTLQRLFDVSLDAFEDFLA